MWRHLPTVTPVKVNGPKNSFVLHDTFVEEVNMAISNLLVSKSNRQNDIPTHILKLCKNSLFLDRCIQQFLNRKYVVTQQRGVPAEPSPSPKYIWLQLPYLGSISNNIWQELSSFIRHKAVVNMKLRCFQSTRKLQSWFSVKDRQALLHRFNAVYKLTCSCGASYIGQTQRNLINRIKEHRMSISSSVCRHLQANPDHRVDFHNPEVIASDNWRRLQILESLLIQEHKPELNANIPSMHLCIFNL